MPFQRNDLSLLSPHLRRSQGRLNLVTGTSGATTSWLVLRYLAVNVAERNQSHDTVDSKLDLQSATKHVVILSWLRDKTFWMDGARKLVGRPQGYFKYSPSQGINTLDFTLAGEDDRSSDIALEGWAHVKSVIDSQALQRPSQNFCLVLDGLDYLLAAGTCDIYTLVSLVSELRARAFEVVVTALADEPFILSQTTKVEKSQAAFLLSLAHQAACIFSLRELPTGAAKDVSGVLRITGGLQGFRGAIENDDVEREYLYYVLPDGSCKVFERGS